MKELKDFPPAQSGRTVIFLLVMVFLLVSGVVHTNIYAAEPTKPGGKILEKSTTMDDPPEISVNRTQLNFGAIVEGGMTSSVTPSQGLLITNSGGGTLDWSIHNAADWLICMPTSGTNSGVGTVSVAPCGLPAGPYSDTIYIYGHGASNSPQTVTVHLQVRNPSQDHPPFGTFETPIHNSHVSSSIPVTGWVLDDVEVDSVKVYNGSSYVGDAVFVEGARPDVEQAYPDYPNNYKAGWGYMLLTNFLPNGGNGTYTLHARATDSEGQEVTLGSKTIFCDNAHAVKPFGAIDSPTQGGTASGSEYINWGWALTPQPKHIPTDGSTINVYVDGVNKGHPTYNIYRKDIAELFPDLANKDGAAGYFYFDTTGYADGVHTIQWTARDNEGVSDGIGSRYFTIRNTNGGNNSQTKSTSQSQKTPPMRIEHLKDLPLDHWSPVRMRKGFREDIQPRAIYPDHEGRIIIEIRELERIELDLFNRFTGISEISGYQVVGDGLQSLPIGSTLEPGKGKFYWMPGPAFFGDYHFVFIEKGPFGKVSRQHIIVKIGPKQF
ncbi:MAG: BACON domain-containing protein [Candidatus Aminicenantes bacterium]|nr:MAG: BACON domain-containing protein [Candidatus Aminicenantes bacterium]